MQAGYGIISASSSGGGGGTSVTIATITSANFVGNDYTNALFGTAVAYDVFSNDGSGTLLKLNDGYTVAGAIMTTTPGNYKIYFYS